jgi:non-heme chloroperoxidase
MAKGLSRAGFTVYAPDMRGHGESGQKGRVSYIGQLEDDLEDFARSVVLGRKVLVGFSAGGGFALRFAADPRRGIFDGYVLLAPFLSHQAGTYRPNGGGWASVGLPRIFALVLLNGVGVSGLNDLAVTAYALTPEASKMLTPSYSYALAMNFRPHNDYRSDVREARQPMEVLVGENDEQFYADRFAAEFAAQPVTVSVVPRTGHLDLTFRPDAIEHTVQAIRRVSGRATLG